MLRLLCVLALIATLFGCAQEQENPTAIVLYVDGDIEDFGRATYRVTAVDVDAGAVTDEPEGARSKVLPQTFVIKQGQAARVLVEVTALDREGRARLTQRAYVTFQPNKTISAHITLTQACAKLVACLSDQTCTVASSGVALCEGIKEAATRAVEKPGDERAWDAGLSAPGSRDGGAQDASSLPSDAQVTPAADAQVTDDASAEPVDAATLCERPRGECNVVSGCGCEGKGGTHCQAREGAGPVCAVFGQVPRNHRCTTNEECAQGLACVGSVCRKYCDGELGCDGDCVPTSSTILEKVCIERCALGSKCGETGVDCVQRKGDTNEGRCLFKHEPCPTNQICEEPVIGTGTCDRGTDAEDCCPYRKGPCDLLDSCGCREGRACQLQRDDMSADAQCGAPGTKARGERCSQQAECAKGLGCFGGLCAEYCRADGDCEERGKCTDLSNLGVAYCRYPCMPRPQNAPSPECKAGMCMREGSEAFCAAVVPVPTR